MKLIALTAALALGGTAFAQTAPAPMTPAPGAPMDQTAPAPAQTPPMAGQTMPGQPSGGDTTMQNQPMGGQGQMTNGGYMPAQPPMAGSPPANATVRFQPSMSPAQAFPPPEPKAEYPICSRGQTDGCRQRGE